MAAGFILSLGAAIGTTAIRDLSDPSVRGFDDVRSLLSVPPLAAIPLIRTNAELRTRRLRGWLAASGTVAAMAGALAFVHFNVRPLDILWITVTRRFGM